MDWPEILAWGVLVVSCGVGGGCLIIAIGVANWLRVKGNKKGILER